MPQTHTDTVYFPTYFPTSHSGPAISHLPSSWCCCRWGPPHLSLQPLGPPPQCPAGLQLPVFLYLNVPQDLSWFIPHHLCVSHLKLWVSSPNLSQMFLLTVPATGNCLKYSMYALPANILQHYCCYYSVCRHNTVSTLGSKYEPLRHWISCQSIKCYKFETPAVNGYRRGAEAEKLHSK